MMTVKFEYKCNYCTKEYIEQRGADESQFTVDCEVCKQGEFIEVNQTVISDTIERFIVAQPTE